jgi:hypothetical protein
VDTTNVITIKITGKRQLKKKDTMARYWQTSRENTVGGKIKKKLRGGGCLSDFFF